MYKKITILVFSFLLIFGTVALAQDVEEPYDVSVPSEFDQAPMFDEKVENGELPPVEDRIPEEPYVVEPRGEIGEYGGTLNSATITINSWGEDFMVMDVYNSFVKPSPEGDELLLNFAQDIEISDDMSTYIIHLRKGAKWSDGNDYTTEDILFWYEDMLLNEEYTPAVGQVFKDANGEVMDLTAVDDYTFKVEFGTPKPYFLNSLVHQVGWNWIYPKHFLKQFHPKYTPEDELEQKLEESDYDHWYELLGYYTSGEGQGKTVLETPTLAAYKLVRRTSDRRVYERNPYFWKVDSEGNQLPYIDRIDTQLVSDREILNGKIMSGEVDFAAYQTDIRNFPMFKQYESEGDYSTLTWTSGFQSDVVYMVNLTHQDQEIREVFQNVKFRRALSLGIDRQEINQSIYFGKAEPVQYTVKESSKFFEPEFKKAYAEYKPEQAQQMLDEIGVKDVNNDGWRELPNGEPFNFTIEFVARETPKLPNVELVQQHWQDLGLNVNSKQISGDLSSQRAPANMMDANLWHGDKSTDILFPEGNSFLIPQAPGWERTIWPAWGRWFQTDGEAGEEPPQWVKDVRNWYEEAVTEPDQEKRIELGKKILEAQAEKIWTIGTVGGSPWVATVDNDLRNIPEDVLWVWDTMWTTTRDPEQFYFTDGVNEE